MQGQASNVASITVGASNAARIGASAIHFFVMASHDFNHSHDGPSPRAGQCCTMVGDVFEDICDQFQGVIRL